MNNNKDPMERIIEDDLLKEAASIDEEIEKAGVAPMPADLKEKIRERLHKQMEEQERERVYAQLSDEDRKALELGREMLKKSESSDAEGKVVRCRRRKKVYVAVAAVAVLVLAMGITSIGGAERVIEMMKVMIEGREVVRVDTEQEEDNYIVTEENEEEAYQEIKDIFGVEAVKLVHWPDKASFVIAEIDRKLQTALFVYEYKGKTVNYYISSHNTSSSWGIDVEDIQTDRYYIDSASGKIEIKEYEALEEEIRSYAAKFSHQELEYFLIGVMEREDFNFLVENLKFF